MKTLKHIMAMAAILAAFSACSLKEDPIDGGDADGVSLRFFTEENFATKADPGYVDKDGETAWNENLLASVEYFLYPDGKTNEDAVIHGYLVNVRTQTAYSVPMTEEIVKGVLCPNNAKYFQVYAIANHARIVPAVAAGGTENLSGTSVPELEALTQELEMVQLDPNNSENVVSNQSKFLMSTESPLRVGPIKRTTTIASANVVLERVAAKLTIALRVEPQVILENRTTVGEITINRDEIWEPRMSEVSIYLVNGALDGQVSGEPLASPTLYETMPIFFDYNSGESHSFSSYKLRTNDNGDPVDENGNVITAESDADKVYDEIVRTGTFFPSKTPFYSYPVKWFFGSADEPYLKLMIPWDRVEYVEEGGNTVRKLKQSKQYYYRVYCPGSTGDGSTCDAEFLRNRWYKVILNVGILGSETDGGEIIINGTYYVADWQERETGSGSGGSGTEVNDSDKEAEIKGARYLFVNKEEYILYNIDDLNIPYITSDPCEIVNFQATRWDFSGSTKQEQTTANMAAWNISLVLDSEGGAHIKFLHPLDNDLNGTTYDVSEYDITFRLRQISNTDYYKDITIKQSPAIKIDLERNTATTSPYNAYVNNGTVSGNTPTWNLGSVPGSGTSSNNNYNMVIIKTSVLPPDSEYMLGDPRTSYIDNLNFSRTTSTGWWPTTTYTDEWPTVNGIERDDPEDRWSAERPSVQGATRRLSFYHPVNNGPEANNIIAPEFRIASSRGATQPMTYANAFRRCASYQEFGYPAGRWRLPTVAEVMYIAKLNADEKIERLLGGGSDGTTDYWCNSGYVTVNNTTTDPPEMNYSTPSGTKYVRCVYDDWYWNGIKYNGNDASTVTKNSFTWGDME